MSLENVFTIVAKPLHYMLTNWICKFVRYFKLVWAKIPRNLCFQDIKFVLSYVDVQYITFPITVFLTK